MRGQLDRYAVQDIETVEGLLYFESGGRLLLHEDYHNHPESRRVVERYLEVLSAGGRLPGSWRSPDSSRRPRPILQPLHAAWRRDTGSYGSSPPCPRWPPTPDPARLQRDPIRDRFEELALASLLALPVVLAIVGLPGYTLTRNALASLQQIASRAEQITSERLHERLEVGAAGDELDYLARVINGLLARLEQSFEQLRRFTSDASHELRTPLASIRSVGEVALQRNGERDQYRDTIGSMLEEVNRLTNLVDSLLTIARKMRHWHPAVARRSTR